MHHEGDRGGARTPYPGTPDDGSGDSHERRSDQIADQIDGCLVHQIEKRDRGGGANLTEAAHAAVHC